MKARSELPTSPKTDALDRETHEQGAAFDRIMNRAVREAQAESRRMGVPNVYSISGVIYFEHPEEGTLSTDDPYEDGA